MLMVVVKGIDACGRRKKDGFLGKKWQQPCRGEWFLLNPKGRVRFQQADIAASIVGV